MHRMGKTRRQVVLKEMMRTERELGVVIELPPWSPQLIHTETRLVHCICCWSHRTGTLMAFLLVPMETQHLPFICTTKSPSGCFLYSPQIDEEHSISRGWRLLSVCAKKVGGTED